MSFDRDLDFPLRDRDLSMTLVLALTSRECLAVVREPGCEAEPPSHSCNFKRGPIPSLTPSATIKLPELHQFLSPSIPLLQ